MTHISDYSESALIAKMDSMEMDIGDLDEEILVKQSDNSYIKDYSRTEMNGGIICIKYKRQFNLGFHGKSALMTLGLSVPFTILAAAVQEFVNTYSHYFDSDTGELLGDSRNDAAKTANRKGIDFCKQGKFDEARQWFNKAYMTCTTDDSQEKTYKNNRDSTAIAVKAERLEEKEKFNTAADKYKQAYDLSNIAEVYSVFRAKKEECLKKATSNSKAELAYTEGVNFCQQDRFKEAVTSFNEAYIECSSGYSEEQTYKNCKDSAKAAAEANKYLQKEEFFDAANMFKEAFDLTNDERISGLFYRKYERANAAANNNHAADLAYKSGLELCRDGRFDKSFQSLKVACLKCTAGYSKETLYKYCRDSLKIAANAEKLLSQEQFTEAAEHFRLAQNSTSVQELWNIFAGKANEVTRLATKNWAASAAYKRGVEFCEQSKYEDSFLAFEEAYNTCVSYKNKKVYANYRDALKIVVNAEKLFQQDQFSQAAEQFKSALNLSAQEIHEIIFTKYNEATEAANKNYAADLAYSKGLEFCKRSRYEEASQAFEEAYRTCCNGYRWKEIYFKCRDSVNLGAEGEVLYLKEQFTEAAETFKQAQDLTDIQEIKDFFQIKYENAIEAKNKNNVANLSYRQALKLCEESRFKEAFELFVNAYKTCTGGYSMEKVYANCKICTNIAAEAEKLMKSGHYSQAEVQFQNARDSSNLVDLEKIFTDRLIKTKAISKCHEGRKMMEEGWNVEEREEFHLATVKFNRAKQLFSEASQLDIFNHEYRDLLETVDLKIRGNKLFNEGVQLQDEATNLKRKQDYQNAFNAFEMALDKFRQGFLLSNDTRFEDCIETVQGHLGEVKDAIQNVDREMIFVDFTKLSINHSSNHEEDRQMQANIDEHAIHFTLQTERS